MRFHTLCSYRFFGDKLLNNSYQHFSRRKRNLAGTYDITFAGIFFVITICSEMSPIGLLSIPLKHQLVQQEMTNSRENV